MMLGTLINTGAVIAGSVVGLLIHSKLPPKITAITFQGIGLFTLFIGFLMAQKTQNPLVMIFSIVIGAIIGEGIDLAKYLERFSNFLKTKIKSQNEKFSEGLITAFLLFCMGSMTIMGAIEEGLGNPPKLFLAKSVLDGFSSIALSTTFGIGVLCSAIPLLIYQSGLTLLFAGVLHNLPSAVINEISAVGGLILIGLGINILEIKTIKILNMLPAMLIAGILAYVFLQYV
jgi:uncharacterized membrane protein YqgA involved in biofilm formation